MENTKQGESFLFTFPFWIIVDTASSFEVKELTIRKSTIRIYPFFRSGAANYLPNPTIDVNQIPFQQDAKAIISPQLKLKNLAQYPSLEFDEQGKTAINIQWSEEWQTPHKNFPMDSLRIDIIGKDGKNGNEFANIIMQLFLKILRESSFQWWINHSTHPITGVLRNTFSIDQNGKPLELPDSLISAYTPNSWTKAINETMWVNAIQKLGGKYEPLLSFELFLDGLYFLATKDLRRTVIEFSISCEYAKDMCFKRLWHRKNGNNKNYKRGKVLSGSSLPVHLHLDLSKFGHSYKIEKPKEYDLLKELWDARGNAAHGEELKIKRNGQLLVVDVEICKAFSLAALDCIKWLNSL